MSIWQIATLLGMVMGAGIYVIISVAITRVPRLSSALQRLTSVAPISSTVDVDLDPDLYTKVGIWASNKLGERTVPGIRPSEQDLNLLGLNYVGILGQKIVYGGVGFILVPVFTLLLLASGSSIPIAVPVIVSIGLAVLMFVTPDYRVRAEAARARATFAGAASHYLDLMGIARASGASTVQSMEDSAQVAKSWPFQRIAKALEMARWSGRAPWAALSDLAQETGVKELDAVSEVVALAGDEGGSIYDSLIAKAESMRATRVTMERAEGQKNGNRLVFPIVTLMVLIVIAMLYPSMLALLAT